MLDHKRSQMIDLLIEGKLNKTEISKVVGVSRTAIYQWLAEPEVVAELNTRLTMIRDQVTSGFTAKLEPVVEELYKIALTATDTRSRKDACIYLINRVLGSPKNVIDMGNEDKDDDNLDVLSAFESIAEDEKIVDIREAK